MDSDTFQELPTGEQGILLLKGPNLFARYLDEAAAATASHRDGWYITWDLARIDHDGFITVEGRLARFSKLGGEMVPHVTVEQKISELYGIDPGEVQAIVVVGIPDPLKGEALVILTTLGLSAGGGPGKAHCRRPAEPVDPAHHPKGRCNPGLGDGQARPSRVPAARN